LTLWLREVEQVFQLLYTFKTSGDGIPPLTASMADDAYLFPEAGRGVGTLPTPASLRINKERRTR
jgi:hypothetical protein